MTEQKFQITVKDSVFQTKGAGLHMFLLFAVCFLLQFVVYVILDQLGIISGKREDMIPLLALVISVLVVCVFYYIRDRKTKGVMKAVILISQEKLEININGRQYIRNISDITEVRKVMLINRIYTEKGKYQLKIKSRGKSSLIFESADQEYEQHLDFEETGLSALYDACKSIGIKCC